MTESHPAVLVTGASTGIGAATAKVLLDNGFDVFGSVRKSADAEALSEKFGDRFTPLLFDVTDEEAVKNATDTVAEKLDGQPLAGLVNNAGIAVGGPLLYLSIDDFRRQLEVNLTGVLIVTQAFAPLLGARDGFAGKPGRIVNIGSVGGRHAFPFMGPYHTTKYGLEGFTESLRRELMRFGVQVVLIAPGSIKTPIWDKADSVNVDLYAKTPYVDTLKTFKRSLESTGARGLPPEEIGETVLQALQASRPRVYYRVTETPLMFHALTKLPKRWVDRAIAKSLRPRVRE